MAPAKLSKDTPIQIPLGIVIGAVVAITGTVLGFAWNSFTDLEKQVSGLDRRLDRIEAHLSPTTVRDGEHAVARGGR